jgi:putative spermidine/putrescine transport system permease protein
MDNKKGNSRFALSLFLGPCFILITFLVTIPLFYIGVISFFKVSLSDLWTPIFTLENYERLLLDPFYLNIIWVTVKVGLISTVVCCILGYPVAYFLARTRSKHVELYMFLLIAPLMISTVIRIFGWIILLGKKGLVNKFLLLLPFIDEPVQLMYNLPAVIIGLTGILLPYMVMPLMSSIESIPRSMEEAARNLGANSAQVFYKVVLPLSVPGLISGSVLVYLISISALVTPALMGAPKVRMLGNQVFNEVLTAFNWPFAASISIVMIIFTFSVLIVYPPGLNPPNSPEPLLEVPPNTPKML